MVALAIIAPVLTAGGVLAAIHWPYRRAKIPQLLQGVLDSKVEITGYYRTYIPHPGFVATGIHLWRVTPSGDEPLGSVETFAVEGRWEDMLRLENRVRLIDISGMHLTIGQGAPRPHQQPSSSKPSDAPPSRRSSTGFTGPSTHVDLLRVHESILDVRRANGGRYSFPIRSLQIAGLQKGHAMEYRVDLEIPVPHGHATADGKLGPFNAKELGMTPVSGEFTFSQVELEGIGNLRGSMIATGNFKGRLGAIEAAATAHSSDFAIGAGQPTQVHGSVQCTVNGLNGDVVLSHAELSSGQTTVTGFGSVTGVRKTTAVEFAIAHGRAEDVLRPFLHSQAPVLGPVALHGLAQVDPPGAPFLQRLRVIGAFDVPAETVTNPGMKRTLSSFSRRMENNRPDRNSNQPLDTSQDALSSLQGPVTIRDGIAASPRLVFLLPGARAILHGTYSFRGDHVDLAGTLKMDAGISHIATGWKSVALKVLSPFFSRKDHPGSKLSIAVIGVPGHYKITHR